MTSYFCSVSFKKTKHVGVVKIVIFDFKRAILIQDAPEEVKQWSAGKESLNRYEQIPSLSLFVLCRCKSYMKSSLCDSMSDDVHVSMLPTTVLV